jgi:hypothetical protein
VITASVTLAQVILGGLLHLHQHARRHLRRRHLLAAHLDPGVAVVGLDDLVGHHLMSFCTTSSSNLRPIRRLTANRVLLRIGDRLALGRLADQHLVRPW